MYQTSFAATGAPTAAVLCTAADPKQGEGRWETPVRCFPAPLPLFRRAFYARSAYSFPLQCPKKPHRQRFPASEIKPIHPESAASLTAPPFCRAPRFLPKRSIPRPSFLGAGCGRRRAEGVRGSPEGFNPSGGIPKGETLWPDQGNGPCRRIWQQRILKSALQPQKNVLKSQVQCWDGEYAQHSLVKESRRQVQGGTARGVTGPGAAGPTAGNRSVGLDGVVHRYRHRTLMDVYEGVFPQGDANKSGTAKTNAFRLLPDGRGRLAFFLFPRPKCNWR